MSHTTNRSEAGVLALLLVVASPGLEASDSRQITKSASGKGQYLVAGALETEFKMEARRHADGSATGNFFHSFVYQDERVEFSGDVTCLSVDPETGRAWIGGTVTINNSEHEQFTQEIHKVGRDIWFRVLDTGEDSEEPDRSTFVGFEGSADIITSEQYCEKRIWPEDNARTGAFTEGGVEVRP